jgi:hypothetical protein
VTRLADRLRGAAATRATAAPWRSITSGRHRLVAEIGLGAAQAAQRAMNVTGTSRSPNSPASCSGDAGGLDDGHPGPDVCDLDDRQR